MKLCENVTFTYTGATAPVLKELCLDLEPGGRMALAGASGSGKTTLFYLLSGLYKPDAGFVSPQSVSMVFQEDRLPPRLTALEQLRLVAPQREESALCAMLEELGLAGWENARPEEMSGGMRRRVALARAAAFSAPLWLLDEPFNGLDVQSLAQAARFVLNHLPHDGMLIAALHKPEEAALLEAPITELFSLQKTEPPA